MRHLLTLIQGEGLGDGIPRAKLRLVGPNETGSLFDQAKVAVLRQNYIGADVIELLVEVKLDAKLLKRHGYFDGVVIDCKNWLYGRFGLGGVPSVGGLRDRAKRGFKTVTFHFEISLDQAKRLGFTNGAIQIILQRGA
jgi:hypothetical protein